MILTFCLIILAGVACIFLYEEFFKDKDLAPKGMEQKHVITVLDKPFYDSYRDGYLVRVRTEENLTETYGISTSLFKDKWKPEDRAGLLDPGSTYYVTTWGTRGSATHDYKNIIELRQLNNTVEMDKLSEETRQADEEMRRTWENATNTTIRKTATVKGGLY